jgi:hypothetical protein
MKSKCVVPPLWHLWYFAILILSSVFPSFCIYLPFSILRSVQLQLIYYSWCFGSIFLFLFLSNNTPILTHLPGTSFHANGFFVWGWITTIFFCCKTSFFLHDAIIITLQSFFLLYFWEQNWKFKAVCCRYTQTSKRHLLIFPSFSKNAIFSSIRKTL